MLATFRARLLLLILLIVIPALGIVLYGNLELRRLEKARLTEKATAISAVAAANQENFVKATRQLLATLTQFPFLLLTTNTTFASVNLANLRKLSPDYVDFGLVELDGTLFCSADLTNQHPGLSNLAFFQRTLKSRKFSIGNYHVNRLTGEPMLNVGYPVANADGEVARILYASLKLSKLSEGIEELEVPPGGTVTVFDQSGTVLARYPAGGEWVGRSLAEVPAMKKILSGPGGGFEMQGDDRVWRLYATTPVTDGQVPGMYASVEVPLTILFARANQALVRNSIILALIAFVVWLVVWWYAKYHILQPVTALAATARKLATGDLSARAGAMHGATELVQLGGALDEMAAGFQARTADLVTANQSLRNEMAEREKAEQQVRLQEQEKKKLEEQFLRSQRMESIGALAGGIAHDLNNALVPIVIGSQMLKESSADKVNRMELLELISKSAHRCTEMVKQILSFARGTRAKAGAVPLRQLVSEMSKIARDTFPKAISVNVNMPVDLWNVAGDTTELHQVLMNLCVNARDAMPTGGTLTLAGENIPATAAVLARHPAAEKLPHVMLTVADTGVGIPADVRARIFEPFFTTKGPEQGTGLGLSTVATLVKRSQGFLEVDSEVGQGSEFRIYLPAVPFTAADRSEIKEAPLPSGNGEMILLADDEQLVLELAKTTLENYGYRVLTADNGLEVIARFESHQHEIKLLVTDADMPFLDGLSAIRAIRKLSPNLPVIVASGIKSGSDTSSFANLKLVASLSKPYDVKQLLKGVANILFDATTLRN